MAKKPGYEGILMEAMPSPPPSKSPPGAEQIAWKRSYLNKLLALFAYYGIKESEPHAHLHLIQALAHAHVPGFKMRGRKPFKGGPEAVQARAALLAIVRGKLLSGTRLTKTAVLRRLAEKPSELPSYYSGRPSISYETLRNDLRSAEVEAAIRDTEDGDQK